MFSRDQLFIGGQWVKPSGSEWLEVVSPTSEEIVGRVPRTTVEDVDRAVAAARALHESGAWSRLPVAERAELFVRLGKALEPRLDEAVELQIDEMGGPRNFLEPGARGVLPKLKTMSDLAMTIPLREVRTGSVGKVIVQRDPVGVVAGVIPWNTPLGLVINKLVPAVLAGCPVIIKPAEESPLSAYMVAEALDEAGVPAGLVSIIAGDRAVGEHLVSHPGVDKVSFTGSSAAGMRIGSICGSQLKPVTLELGGKSAAIVLDDADLDREVSTIVAHSMPNNGQVCIATTRILVSDRRHDELLDRLVEAVGQLRVGDPHDAETDVGPLVAERQRVRVEGYIQAGLDAGAKIALGGGRPDYPTGWFVEPTIFTDVDNSMKIAREEIFGPVGTLLRYDDVDQAVEIANDSEFGLGGAVISSDPARALEVATRMQTGSCAINNAPGAGGGGPFGGFKHSGLGREFSREGFDSYYELKSIALPAGFEPDPTV